MEPSPHRPHRLLRRLARVGLVRPRPDKPVDELDDGYFEWEQGTAAGVWEYYARFLPADQQGLLVIDVASGPGGRTLAHASKSEARFVALDQDRVALRSTLSKAGRENLNCLVADAYRLPFATGSVDVVLCENAMEHFDDPQAAVAEMSRVLKLGGLLLMVFPPWRAPYAGHLGYMTRWPWIHLLPAETLSSLLEAMVYEREGPSAWQRTRARGRAGLGSHLNRIPLQVLLDGIRQQPFELVGSYLVPEWGLGRILRFVPAFGEAFSSAVYLALRRSAAPSSSRWTLRTLQIQTLFHRKVRPDTAVTIGASAPRVPSS